MCCFADLQCHVPLVSHHQDIHSHGRPYNMPTLHDVNVKNNLMVIEVEHLEMHFNTHTYRKFWCAFVKNKSLCVDSLFPNMLASRLSQHTKSNHNGYNTRIGRDVYCLWRSKFLLWQMNYSQNARGETDNKTKE